jgi:hypothetical protein
MRSVLAVGTLALALAGCGSASVVVTGEPVSSPYDGPMAVPIDYSDDATVLERSGAAGRALECTGDPYNGGGADYDDGLESVQDSPEAALENLFREEGVSWGMPTEGYRVERRDDGRVLFSYDVGELTKAAYVVSDEVKDWKHHTGWGVEAWAQCDPAEFPTDFTDDLQLAVWTDASGAHVPVSKVTSWPGPEHCDWQDITFLEIGSRETQPAEEEYLRDTHGELADFLNGSYDAHAALPEDATDTGWQHDGRELWLMPDKSAAYLVRVDDTTDVERWPASTDPIGCD